LDETYERVLKEIKKPNREHARRVLQCLVVAIRPLRVEELAEVLAVDFDDAEGIPKLDASWRWEDQEQALLSSCSSLIAIVGAEDSQIVQFSHFSVKEFLTSPRLGTSSRDVSCYHVDLERAHTIMAQACLGVLLQLGDAAENTIQQSFPLAQYAAEHWASHARFKNVSANVHRGMECLFDPDEPHLLAWLRLHNIDGIVHLQPFYQFVSRDMPQGRPLYYASLYGLHDLARHLTAKYPEQVNTRGGYHVTPLVAALSQEHFQTATFLRRNGADPNVRGHLNRTPLHAAAYSGNVQVVDNLIKYNADLSVEDSSGSTPLHMASMGSKGPDVARLLLDHGADVNSREVDGSTPLHHALGRGGLEVARVLIEHGADVQVEDKEGRTPLQIASKAGYGKMMELLREYGAK